VQSFRDEAKTPVLEEKRLKLVVEEVVSLGGKYRSLKVVLVTESLSYVKIR